MRQRHTPALQQIAQVCQDSVAAVIQVRHLVLAHPHGQVPPDEAALSEINDEGRRVERGRDQVEALHDGGGLEDLAALRVRAAGHRPRPALGHLTEPVVGEGVDRHDDVAPPLPQRLGQGDVDELGRPVGRRGEVAGVHGRRRAQVVVGDLLGACEVLGDEEGRQVQIHAGVSAILGGSRSGRPRGLGWGLGQVAPVQEEADRLALGQRQTGAAPRRAQARRGRAQTQRGRVALVQPLVDGDPPQVRPPAQGLLDDANHLCVGGAGTAGGGDEHRLGARGRLDGNDPPRQGVWPGGGEVLPQAHQDRKRDLRRDPGELGDHALAGGVIGAQSQQVVEPAGEDPGAGGQQTKGVIDVAARQHLLQVGGETRFGAPGGDLAQELGGADATALAGRGRREMDCSSVVSSVGATLAVVPGD